MRIQNRIKNIFLIFLLKLVRLFQEKASYFDTNIPKILIVSTTALGDTLWATPVIKDIRKKYKDGYIACLCSSQSKAVLEKNRDLNKIFLTNRSFLLDFFPLFKALKKEKFQAILVLHCSQRWILPMCYLLNSSIFASTQGKNKGLDSLFSHLIPQVKPHEIDRRFEIAKSIAVEKTTSEMYFYFEEDRQFIQSDINQNISRPLIIFHPGAKDSYRCWDRNSYVELGQLLYSRFHCTIAITGNDKEKKLVFYLANNIPQAKPYAGNLDLTRLATLYKNADLIIAGDTGPLHLALTVRTKTIALFVPTDPQKFGPLDVFNNFVVKKSKTCNPCKNRNCKNPKCFLQITPEEVLDLCQKILR